MVEVFYNRLFEVIDLSVPKRKTISAKHPNWFKRSLVKLLSEKEKVRNKYHKYNNPRDNIEFQILRSRCHKLFVSCFNDFKHNAESDISKNPKHFWKYFKHKKKGELSLPSSMKLDNKVAKSGTEIANLFATHFSSIYTEISHIMTANFKQKSNVTQLSNVNAEQFVRAELIIQHNTAQATALNAARETDVRNAPMLRVDKKIVEDNDTFCEDMEERAVMSDEYFLGSIRGLNIQQRDLFQKVSTTIENDLHRQESQQLLFITGGITYPGGVEVEEGNEITPTQAKDQPTVSWDTEPNAFYTIVMIDPDARNREWQHWLVGNVPGSDVSKGDVLATYVGAGPSPGTGLHRYVFLVYKQPDKIEFDEERRPNVSPDGRLGFSIAKFAEKYNFGKPVAGNFYLAQYDDYVRLLNKELGD
ncbi:unnamed protein product [Parnassius mnemosyne]|uniref:Phosphatidylethanolamine-binding protein n=1 Tax=Parnassius mnemosyne TaxID=213953 RepID=A0AAV1L5G1_9NEOP